MELDSMILDFISSDTQALSALSKVLKHYRALAEPYLYKKIVLNQHDEHGLMRLFFTLLARKDLALHILSFTLVPSPRI
jgi:hypothetical protein